MSSTNLVQEDGVVDIQKTLTLLPTPTATNWRPQELKCLWLTLKAKQLLDPQEVTPAYAQFSLIVDPIFYYIPDELLLALILWSYKMWPLPLPNEMDSERDAGVRDMFKIMTRIRELKPSVARFEPLYHALKDWNFLR